MSTSMRERPVCEVCGASDPAIILSRPFTDPAVMDFVTRYYEGRVAVARLEGASYAIAQCRECSFLWQMQILDDEGLSLLYGTWIKPEGSRGKRERGERELYAGYAREILVALALVGRSGATVRVLDHGMGWGYWCLMARAFGCKAAGTEISDERCAYAERNGVSTESIDALPSEHYDFINAEQSLEHIPRSHENLRTLAAALRSGGVVRIAVPDAGRTLDRLRQLDWRAAKDPFHPLEHINCFTHAILRRLCAEAGLVPVAPPVFPVVALGSAALVRQAAGTFYYRFRGTKLYFRKSS